MERTFSAPPLPANTAVCLSSVCSGSSLSPEEGVWVAHTGHPIYLLYNGQSAVIWPLPRASVHKGLIGFSVTIVRWRV